MAALCALVLLFAAAACSAANIPNRIVGGAPTTIERYPSIVQVEYQGTVTGNWDQTCAGSILNSLYFLSAAHCFAGSLYSPTLRRIRAGATQRNSGGIIVYVTQEFNYPTYSTLGYDGDISVVRLTTALVFGPTVQPGTIPSQGAELRDHLPVVHAGWGAVSQGGPSSDVLLDVTIYVVNHEVCASRYGGSSVTENMICAGILDEGGKDACQDDSGGPLYFGNFIVGVVSWGYGCADAYYPGVSTKVSSYTNWIVATAV